MQGPERTRFANRSTPLDGDFDAVWDGGKTTAQTAFAGRAGGAAGYACYFLSFEQLARKAFCAQPGGLDAREGAEGTAREMTGQPHLVEGADDEVPAGGALDCVKEIADAGARDGGHGLRDKLVRLKSRRAVAAASALSGGVRFKASRRSNDRGPGTSSLVF